MDSRLTATLPHVLNPTDGEVGRILGSSVKEMSKNKKLAALLGVVAIAFFVAIMIIQSSHH